MNNCKDEINDEDKIDDDSDKPPSINSTCSTSTDSISQTSSVNEKKSNNAIEDYEILYTLGKGSFGKVVLGHNIYTHQQYAIKYVSKRFVEKVMN